MNWLGDAVMTMPALKRIRERFPNSSISILTDSKLADLWNLFPVIGTVLTFDRTEGVRAIARRLRGQGFDLGIALPNSWRSAAELWLASIPIRYGFRNDGRGVLLTHAISKPSLAASTTRKRSVREIRRLTAQIDPVRVKRNPAALHHASHYLDLAKALGANPEPTEIRLSISTEAKREFSTRIGIASSPDSPLIGINPGAEYGPAKRWPPERFIAAACEIRKRTNCRWIIFGSRGDAEVASEIERGLRRLSRAQGSTIAAASDQTVFNLAGSTSLSELLAGLSLCRLLITNDSGPMHCAAALGTAVVAVFGSTSPELTSPEPIGGNTARVVRSDVPCSPCFRRVCPIDSRCMHNIEVDAVVEAAIELFLLSPGTNH